ncbi:MAG: hypothetical protein AB7O73_12590 [Bacteroidia bacterium]
MTDVSLLSVPLIILIIVLGLVLFVSIRSIFEASKVLHEAGIPFSPVSVFYIDFSELLKWTAANNKKVAAVIFILVISGIIWTINFSSNK